MFTNDDEMQLCLSSHSLGLPNYCKNLTQLQIVNKKAFLNFDRIKNYKNFFSDNSYFF
jgi:hypothetical protein